jgi:hypothetical protein
MNTLTQFDPLLDFEDRLLDKLLHVQATIVHSITVRRRRRVWGIGLSTAAAAIVVAVVLQVAPVPVNAPPPASAATEFHKLSVVASSQPAVVLEPGQYVYTDSVSNLGPGHESGNTYNVDFLWTRQFWVAPDGSGHGVFTASDVTFPTPRDQAAWVAQGSPNIVAMMAGESTFGPGDYGPMGIDEFTLPTDQSQLSQVIASHLASVTNVQPGSVNYAATEFSYVGSLLQETAAPPAVQAALLTLAQNLPGIILIGPNSAPDGVAGVGFATAVPTGGGPSQELIFNPSTGALVAQEYWSTDSLGSKTLVRWTSYVAGGLVDNTSTTVPISVPSSSAASN